MVIWYMYMYVGWLCGYSLNSGVRGQIPVADGYFLTIYIVAH